MSNKIQLQLSFFLIVQISFSDERPSNFRLWHHWHPWSLRGCPRWLHRPEQRPVRHLLIRICINRSVRFAARKSKSSFKEIIKIKLNTHIGRLWNLTIGLVFEKFSIPYQNKLANINDEKYLKQFLDYSKLRKSCWSWHLLGQSRSKSSDLRRKTNPKKVAL